MIYIIRNNENVFICIYIITGILQSSKEAIEHKVNTRKPKRTPSKNNINMSEEFPMRSPRLTQWVAFLIFSTITMGAASELVSNSAGNKMVFLDYHD